MLAAPNFESWRKGIPLRIDQWLAPVAGRTPCNIVYMAHLADAERMFVVGSVLNELTAWMRRQRGSDSLRALLYFDEIAGYMPPHPANPASKAPLLMLLKQARAFGLGVLLATQNPVDVDYKGMTNAGTWLVGKLQAQGDKDRLLDGLALATGAGPSRAELDNAISALKGRQFLLKNVHQPGTPFVTTRWAMSYLAGPLSLQNLPALFDQGLVARKPPRPPPRRPRCPAPPRRRRRPSRAPRTPPRARTWRPSPRSSPSGRGSLCRRAGPTPPRSTAFSPWWSRPRRRPSATCPSPWPGCGRFSTRSESVSPSRGLSSGWRVRSTGPRPSIGRT